MLKSKLLQSALVTASLSLVGTAHAQQASDAGQTALRLLQQQGQYWQDRGDFKRAAESWEKLLQVEPQNARAFYGMGLGALQQDDVAQANVWLDRLRAQGSGSARYAALLAQAIHFDRQGTAASLEQARTLVVSRDLEGAIAKYDEAFQGQPPQGKLAYEYYNYLGYTKDGLARAIKGLDTLVRSEPGNKEYELGLAKHLVRDLPRRQEGLKRLQALSGVPAVASEAQEAWRVALMWIGPPGAEYRKSFEAYLALHNDEEVRQLLRSGEQRDAARRAAAARAAQASTRSAASSEPVTPWVQDARITAGMQALEADDLVAAERSFQEKLRETPRNADALGGLGLVRMKQKDFSGAETLLARAAKSAKDWQKALDAARYWKWLDDAGQAAERGDFAGANRLVARARALDETNVAAFNRLAHIQAIQEKWKEATATYASVLEREPRNVEALQGMVYVLEMQGQPETALRLAQGLDPSLQVELGDLAPLRKRVAALHVREALKRGDDDVTEPALLEAMRDSPGNVWLGYELARLYLRQNDLASARSVMDEVLQEHPGHPDALYAGALVAEQQGDWSAVRELLARVPDAQRSDEIRTLAQRARLWGGLEDARRVARQGDTARAAAMLSVLEQERGLSTAQLTEVADAMVEVGQVDQGLALMRKLVPAVGTSEAGIGLMLRYAAALAQGGQLVEADIVVRQLQGARLNPEEREALAAVSRVRAEKQARPDAEPESLGSARALLAVAAASRRPGPRQPVLVAKAQRENEVPQLDRYRAALARDPGNIELAMQAAEAAGRQGDARYMETALGNAVALAPDDVPLLARAARLSRQYGSAAQAEHFYESAVTVAQAQEGDESNALPALRSELAAIREDRNIELRVGAFMRANNGEAGTSRVRETSAPLEARLPVGTGTVALRVTPVRLDAGTVGAGYGAHGRFGGGPLAAADAAAAAVAALPASADDEARQLAYRDGLDSALSAQRQRDSGVGVALAYESDAVKADIGTTPLGFQRTNIVGGVALQGALTQDFGYDVDLSRRAVTDSLLSYAGTTDERTGQEWGGVSSTGATARLGWDDGEAGAYGYGGWHALRGRNVASNWRADGGAGAYWHLHNTSSERLTAGVHAGAIFFQRNLRFFTYGHGGYFSPQSMYMLSLPVTWAKRGSDFSYRLQGAVGVQHFKEDGADYFPTDSALQARAEMVAAQAQAAGVAGATARYDSQSHTGVAYNLAAAAEYRFTPQWFLGGTMTLNNARDYRQWGGGLYLRYLLYPSSKPFSLPLEPYRSPYDNP